MKSNKGQTIFDIFVQIMVLAICWMAVALILHISIWSVIGLFLSIGFGVSSLENLCELLHKIFRNDSDQTDGTD